MTLDLGREAVRMIGREARAMGSPLRLLVAATHELDEAEVDAMWRTVVAEFEATEEGLSRFRESSAITRLSRAGRRGLPTIPPRLRRALAAADRAVRVTGGRFEPRIVDDLEQLGFVAVAQRAADEAHTPTSTPANRQRRTPEAEAGERPSDVERGHRRLCEATPEGGIRLPEPVDFGGIGKGLALRWAANAIESASRTSAEGRSGRGGRHAAPGREPVSEAGPAGPAPALLGFVLDAGGDVVIRGTSGDGPWRVGIEDPEDGSATLAVVAADGPLAVATSSTRINSRTDTDGSVVHHLIDPRTRRPAASGLRSVTVAASDPAWAEVWSKSLFVEGRARIAALARSRGLAAWWVALDGGIEMTPAARELTRWVVGEDAVRP